jgi:hypothetical protein
MYLPSFYQLAWMTLLVFFFLGTISKAYKLGDDYASKMVEENLRRSKLPPDKVWIF